MADELSPPARIVWLRPGKLMVLRAARLRGLIAVCEFSA
jgi:hypothetical protein